MMGLTAVSFATWALVLLSRLPRPNWSQAPLPSPQPRCSDRLPPWPQSGPSAAAARTRAGDAGENGRRIRRLAAPVRTATVTLTLAALAPSALR